MTRRESLRHQVGLAASFMAFNTVFGPFFAVDPIEAASPEAARENLARHADQFVFDVQVHFVHDAYPSPGGLLSLRRAADVDDVGPAARDWPDLNSIIYHSAIEKVIPTQQDVEAFRKTGRIDWVTRLAEIPQAFGVSNVYAELGAMFAATCAAHPELCAGLLGTLIRGMGDDHVCWGTDSVWFGSPQWQIEALRRFEIPEDLQKQYGFAPLGPADGPVKRKIFGENSARLYGIDPAGNKSPS